VAGLVSAERLWYTFFAATDINEFFRKAVRRHELFWVRTLGG
jgi:hypothetical protein|tara:strand:+ start:14811 stop:14936 length:126 start_codon:yes stop_codon:yes gene_type:complete